ncbi:MAG: DEAD/DEAH box helicase, partial [Acidobacteriota bacterium]
MNVFELRDQLVADYSKFVRSFIEIRDERIRDRVEGEFHAGLLWPDPLIQVNPSFEPGDSIEELVDTGLLHEECRRIFRIKEDDNDPGRELRLHRHQSKAVRIATEGHNYVLTTGTGSGKSLAYIIPIVDHVLRSRDTGEASAPGNGKRIQAIIVYPMNALANSQMGELERFLCRGYPAGRPPVTFRRYTGQEDEERKAEIIENPPDILLTNYVMLELILTRTFDRKIVEAATGLKYLVLDELHTYRGRQGADIALLVRRTREAVAADELQIVGTSATLAGEGTYKEQRAEVAGVATRIFGTVVKPEHVIGETVRRSTPERDLEAASFVDDLRTRIESEAPPSQDFQSFAADPLSSWIESEFGLEREGETGRLIRRRPRSITGEGGAAKELAKRAGLPEDACRRAIERHLLASYKAEPDPQTRFPVFSFRLHQFISRGDTVYATPEAEAERYLTLQGQQYVPGDRARALLPLVFCRECGQEYYCVRQGKQAETNALLFTGIVSLVAPWMG